MTRLTLFKVSMDPGLRRYDCLGVALLAIALAYEIG
ncbi:MAG: hypothetical protein JWP34_4362 [Massilia sp.]|nr:hypothetical protein [Massilia sp.]